MPPSCRQRQFDVIVRYAFGIPQISVEPYMRVTCADGQEVWFLPVDGDRVPFGSVHDGRGCRYALRFRSFGNKIKIIEIATEGTGIVLYYHRVEHPIRRGLSRKLSNSRDRGT